MTTLVRMALGAPRRVVGEVLWAERRLRATRGDAERTVRAAEDAEIVAIESSGRPRPAAGVAVIIPTFKRPALLERAVASVLSQNVLDRVIVIVDDGGGGVPSAIADQDDVTVVELSRNLGCVGAVRNVGIRTTSSEHLAFLDDDNEWEQGHLERALEAHSSGAMLTYSSLRLVDRSGALVDTLSLPFSRRAHRRRNGADVSAITVRRSPASIFSRMPRGRDEPREDWELVWRLSRLGHVHHFPEPSVRYLVNPESYYSSWSAYSQGERGSGC